MADFSWDNVLVKTDPDMKEVLVSFKKVDGGQVGSPDTLPCVFITSQSFVDRNSDGNFGEQTLTVGIQTRDTDQSYSVEWSATASENLQIFEEDASGTLDIPLGQEVTLLTITYYWNSGTEGSITITLDRACESQGPITIKGGNGEDQDDDNDNYDDPDDDEDPVPDGDPIDPEDPFDECEDPKCPDLGGDGNFTEIAQSPELLYRETGNDARTPNQLVISRGPVLWTPPSPEFGVDNWGHQFNEVVNAWGNVPTGLYHLTTYRQNSSINATAIVNQYTIQSPGNPAYDWHFNVLGLGPGNACTPTGVLSYGSAALNSVGLTTAVGDGGPWRTPDGQDGAEDKQGTLMRSASNSLSWTIIFHYEGTRDTTGATLSIGLCENRCQMRLVGSSSSTVGAATGISWKFSGAGSNAQIEVGTNNTGFTSIPVKQGWNFIPCSVSSTFAMGARIWDVIDGEPIYQFAGSTTSAWSCGGAAGAQIAESTQQLFNGNQYWNYEKDTAPRYGRYSKCGFGIIKPISGASNWTSSRGLQNLNVLTTGALYDPGLLNQNNLSGIVAPGTKEIPEYCERIP